MPSSTSPRFVPGPITGLSKIVAVHAGAGTNCARDAAGIVQCWGFGITGLKKIPLSGDFVLGNNDVCEIVAGEARCTKLVDGKPTAVA